MASPALSLLPMMGSVSSVKVHPVVLFAICDGYIRRSDKQERIIGTLLGSFTETTLEIKNCYVVPHNESTDQVAVDINHHRSVYDLHQKVSPGEVIVGWFATGPSLYHSDTLIQEFYSKESANSVHLLVDTTLAGGKFDISAFVARSLTLGDKQVALEFVGVPSEVLFSEAEKLGAELLSAPARAVVENETLATAVKHLTELVAKVAEFADAVVEGKIGADPTLGRYLADTVALVPHLTRIDFERLNNDSAQDMLLVMYLSNLVRAHLALAERLGTSALPLL